MQRGGEFMTIAMTKQEGNPGGSTGNMDIACEADEHVGEDGGGFLQVAGLTYEIHSYIESRKGSCQCCAGAGRRSGTGWKKNADSGNSDRRFPE